MKFLAFVRSGYEHLTNSNIVVAGYGGNYWSRVAQSTVAAYDLGMNPTAVYPSYYFDRWNGFPLRCLYPV